MLIWAIIEDLLTGLLDVFHCHLLQSQYIDMIQQLQELDLAKGRYWELFIISLLSFPPCGRIPTPSFSLCIRIFFNATTAPVFVDFAWWTSL